MGLYLKPIQRGKQFHFTLLGWDMLRHELGPTARLVYSLEKATEREANEMSELATKRAKALRGSAPHVDFVAQFVTPERREEWCQALEDFAAFSQKSRGFLVVD